MASIASSRVSTAALLLLAGSASAALLPAERPAALPALAVLDAQGAMYGLPGLAAGAPALLLPIFTRCTGTCPMTAVYLRDALARAGAPFRVVVFSFDTADTAADLRDFRDRFALPGDWIVVRSGDAAATRAFLDGLDFHFMKSADGFDHPNETFVFSPRGRWAATLTGASFDVAELRDALRRALAADDPSPLQRLRAWLIRPEAWILVACAGLAASLLGVLLGRKAAQAQRSGRGKIGPRSVL